MYKKQKAVFFILALIFSMPFPAFAGADNQCVASGVVINEIAWAGSIDSSNDEWIELYNLGCEPVDLSGWKIIDDDTTSYLIETGTIAGGGYFLLEDSEEAVSNVSADQVVGLSLANSGDSLILKDNEDNIIDTVNSAGGPWFAGDNENKGSMEKIDSEVSGDHADNWATATAGNGSISSNGSAILGTPGSRNSVSFTEQELAKVMLTPSTTTPVTGSTLTLSADAANVVNLFAYGVTIDYDPQVLTFKSASKGPFLSDDSLNETSFQAALENNTEGRLVLGEAWTSETARDGQSGDGILFTVSFNVIGDADEKTDIVFGGDSFFADAEADIMTEFFGTAIEVQARDENETFAPQNVRAAQAESRYTIVLNWDAPQQGADYYSVQRKNQAGEFIEIAQVNELEMFDTQDIIPHIAYEYQVLSVKGENRSEPVKVSASETRGLTGDANRSDRVDGRDLEIMARLFGNSMDDQSYEALSDFNYDGRIDGKDLIDLAANWASTY